MSCLYFYFSLFNKIIYKQLTLFCIVYSFILYIISLINFSARFKALNIFKSSTLYNMNKIENKNDLCKISILMFISLNVISLKHNCVICFIKKLRVNLINYVKMHLCFIL